MKDYLVIYDRAEDGAWGAHSPDVEGVFALGTTREETELRMAEALAAHLAYLRDQGLPAPGRTPTPVASQPVWRHPGAERTSLCAEAVPAKLAGRHR